MDSLKIISDINDHLTTLDAKVDKTSKSASLAFSYLYSKVEQIDNCVDTFKVLEEKVSYVASDIEKTKLYSYSYFTSVNGNCADIKLTTSNSIIYINDKIKEIENRFDEIDTKLDAINERLIKIIDCPEKFIVVKQEPPIIIMFFRSIHNWFYRLFHAKQIREEQERIAEEERKKQEAEEERKKKEAFERQKKAEQEKLNKQNKIKNILGK
ncbi:MAG: hypothetical protein IJH39_11200 [Clostridia bacterium]|nr:hypothetical protein [Clostridia bacterium]